ncbi:ribosomal L1 domain-containing protein 1-like isoform X1 [Montipora foliosa]|uniref:ribosomal L1 domain-containing protein 1-like isoform X1 n=1 Tax=Montipora foliosa TaxID=591990 RepID=UPI0035F1B904
MVDSRRKPVRESQLETKQVKLAIPALLKYVDTKKGKQLNLLNEHDNIQLIIALKKIPSRDKKPRKIPLPHSLHSDSTEVCLITKEESSVVKEMLKAKDVTVNKVISLKKLRKKYNMFEARRQLCSLYDIFICDERIYHLLPRALGKTFMSKKKLPVPVDLKKTNLKKEIAKVLQCSLLSFGFGPCSSIKVAHTGQTAEQAVENVIGAVAEIAKIVPRGWKNIKSLNLKTTDSISLPIYTSLPEKSLDFETSEPLKKKRKKS